MNNVVNLLSKGSTLCESLALHRSNLYQSLYDNTEPHDDEKTQPSESSSIKVVHNGDEPPSYFKGSTVDDFIEVETEASIEIKNLHNEDDTAELCSKSSLGTHKDISKSSENISLKISGVNDSTEDKNNIAIALDNSNESCKNDENNHKAVSNVASSADVSMVDDENTVEMLI